ncbi:hypothetical protein Hanom_Chr05g00473591 [Helianthus anomalus]
MMTSRKPRPGTPKKTPTPTNPTRSPNSNRYPNGESSFGGSDAGFRNGESLLVKKAPAVENVLGYSLLDLYKGAKKKMKISRMVLDSFGGDAGFVFGVFDTFGFGDFGGFLIWYIGYGGWCLLLVMGDGGCGGRWR